jgi:CDP-paratose 2-epimerase
MKVLITGGCGFLGSNLAAFYLENGARVVLLDALFRAGAEENLGWLRARAMPEQLLFVRGDLAETSTVDEVFKVHGPFDFVCHVGGQVAMTSSLKDPRRDLMTNVVGTFNVLESVRRYSPTAFVAFSSTNKVYGDLGWVRYEETASRYIAPDFPNGFDETLPLDFSTPYGCSKGAADQYVRDWCRNYGVETVVFRHSSIYGGRQFATIDQGWVGWFCEKVMEQKKANDQNLPTREFTISGTGKQVRDVLHCDDLVRLYHAAYMRRSVARGNVFNIGGGMHNSLSIVELIHLLKKLLRSERALDYVHIPRRCSDQDVFIANINRVERELDWAPQISSEQGINKMLAFVDECLARRK